MCLESFQNKITIESWLFVFPLFDGNFIDKMNKITKQKIFMLILKTIWFLQFNV